MAPKTDKVNVKIGDTYVKAEVARTLASQSRGLSDREYLDPDSGMIFLYDDKKIRNFWMRDMKIHLDVIWIAENKVIGTQENIPYESENGEEVRFKSQAPADAALEVNAGWVSKHGISIGDAVDIVEN